MAGYRFSNPNYSSTYGTVGDALNRAAGSIDNIAIAMLRSAKTPEERAMMSAHQNAYDSMARKSAAEASLLEQQGAIASDPMGSLATAMFGPAGRGQVVEAQNFNNGMIDGPIQPNIARAMPQLQRDARTMVMARGTGDKNIGDIMKLVMQQGVQDDVATGRISPQNAAVQQYVSGASTNKPFDIDTGGLKVEFGSGNVIDTPVSQATVKDKNASANQHNAAAGRESAHARLYRAQADNEVAGLPGRSGGKGAKGAETEKQRIDREAYNEETLRARERISKITRDDVNNAAKGSSTAVDYQKAIRPLKGVDDAGYDEFIKNWGEPPKETVAAALKRASQLASEPGRMYGYKYEDDQQGNKGIGELLRKEFNLSPSDSTKIVQQVRSGNVQQASPAAAPAQQPQQQKPVAGGASGTSIRKVSTPAEAQSLPPGTVYQTPDGRTFTR